MPRTTSLLAASLLAGFGYALLAGLLKLPGPQLGVYHNLKWGYLIFYLSSVIAALSLAGLAWQGCRRWLQRPSPATENGAPSSRPSADPANDFAEFLEPGEVILWEGRPDPDLFQPEIRANFFLGVILLLAAACAGSLVAVFLNGLLLDPPQFKPELLCGLLVVLLPFVCFSLIARGRLSSSWSAAQKIRRAGYVVTDRRVLIRPAFGWEANSILPDPQESLYVIPARSIAGRKLRHRSRRRTDIVLFHETHWGGGIRGRKQFKVAIGILGATNWKEAEAVLQRFFPGKQQVDAQFN